MNGSIDIYSPSGTLIRTHIFSANCVRKFSLMSEDSITLRFSSREPLRFPVGSYAGDFVMTQEQVGKWNAATGVWDYELKFDAYYWAWANKLLRYVVNGVDSARETSFTLTSTIDIHANVIKNCLDLLGFKHGGSPFRIDTTDTSLSTEAKLVRYDNLSILGGIQAIAEAFECEWWVDGNAIYFGRCEKAASKHVFKVGINTSSITFNQAKSEAPNRLYVYGSERNLPTNYRAVTGNDTIGGVVARRLMLPEGIPYLQTDPDLAEAEIVEGVAVLEDVYPHTDLTISADPETYTSNGEDADGNATTETFFRIRYGNSFRFSQRYILPDEELHIVFESGLLNGMDFGAKFNPKGLNEKNADGSWNPDAQMIEIVANEDYGRKLPDEMLRPRKGDRFTLYGWDATKMADLGLISDAEQELLEEGQKALEEYSKDLSSCTCPMAWDYMKPLVEKSTQPMPGDVVTIVDTAHFGEGGRKSRIIGFEYKLDKPYAEWVYTCGENISTPRLKTIEQKIEGLAKSGTKVQMQNSLDFLSKRYADRTPYRLSSSVGFEAGTFVPGASGAMVGAQGDIEGERLFMRGLAELMGDTHFGEFISGMWAGKGGRIDNRGNAEVESIRVRSYMEVLELIVNRLSAIEGDQLLSESDTIEEVTDHGDGTYTLKVRPKWEGYWTGMRENDVCKGIFNNITGNLLPGDGQGQTTIHNAVYYTSWFRVVTVNAPANTMDVVLYPDAETPAGRNFPPQPMMAFARWGNSGGGEDKETERRQQCIMLSSTEGRICKLYGVTKPIIDKGNYAFSIGTAPEFLDRSRFGDHVAYFGTIAAERFIEVEHQGRPKPTIVFRGSFDPAADYFAGDAVGDDGYTYERSVVEFCGCQWICSLTGTHSEPSWTGTDWTFYMGDSTFRVFFGNAPAGVNPGRFRFTLDVHGEKGGQDVTGMILPQDVSWTRYSEGRDGVERVQSDAVWANRRGASGLSIELTQADLDSGLGVPDVCRFTATVTLRDGTVQTTSYSAR